MREDEIKPLRLDPTYAQVSPRIPPWVYGKLPKAQHAEYVEGKSYLLKRPFDVLIAMIGLAIASPLWLVFAIAIKLEVAIAIKTGVPSFSFRIGGVRTRAKSGYTNSALWSPTRWRGSAMYRPERMTPV